MFTWSFSIFVQNVPSFFLRDFNCQKNSRMEPLISEAKSFSLIYNVMQGILSLLRHAVAREQRETTLIWTLEFSRSPNNA